MPRHLSPSAAKHHSQSLGEIDKIVDKAFAPPRTPPPVTPIYFPAGSDCASVAWEPCHGSSEESESLGPETPPELGRLDKLWEDLRHKKGIEMVKSHSKVRSFKGLDPPLVKITSHEGLGPSSMKTKSLQAAGPSSMEIKSSEDAEPSSIPLAPTATKHAIKRRKSHASFRESQDGRTVTATFDMPGIRKQDVHVSYQRSRLIINWQTITVTEKEEGDKIVRERREKKYDRIIPLPNGTRFEEIHAAMDGRHLILTYPNMRSVRAESRGRQPRAVEPPAPRSEHW